MQKLQDVLDDLDAKEEELAAAQEELERKDDDLNMAGRIGEQLLEKTRSLEEELSQLRDGVGAGGGNDYKEDYEVYKRKHEQAISAFQQATREINDKDAEISRLEDQLQEHRRRHAKAQQLRTPSKRGGDEDSDGSEDGDSVESLRDQKMALEKEVKKLRQSVSKANRSAASADQTINELYTDLAGKDETISSLRSKLGNAAQQLSQLEVGR